MGDGNGNVLLSRGFQFAETETAHAQVIDHELIWTPVLPKTFALMKAKWIYAYAFVPNQKGILAAEYFADKNGALTFVPGAKRRLIDAPNKPDGKAVPEVTLPLVVQGHPIKYAFVATRGRMGKAAIWDMENALHPIYERMDLNDNSHFHAGANNQQFVAIIDVLALGVGLHRAYIAARDAELHYTTGLNTGEKAQARLRTQKYRLAKMIKDSLLAPDGELTDPLSIQSRLANNGHDLLDFVDQHESKSRRFWWSSRNAGRDLVRLLNSSLWTTPYYWYLGTEQSANKIGHYWLDASFRCIDRLSEIPEGAALIRQLVTDQENGLLSFLLPPEDGADKAAEAEFSRRFAWMRKSATAIVIGLAETVPALLVHGKAKKVAPRVVRTLKGILVKTEIESLALRRVGIFATALKIKTRPVQIRISFENAKPDLEELLTQGKPHWPEGSHEAKASDLLGRLFIFVEIANFYFNWAELRDMSPTEGASERAQAQWEVLGGVLDLTVASEDLIRGLAKTLDESRKGGGGIAAAGAAEGEAVAEKEAAGLFEKLAAPVVFKALGAASAAIDSVVYYLKAKRHGHEGQVEVAFGEYAVAGGNAVLVGASIVNGIGYLMVQAAGTAAELATATAVTGGAALILVVAVAIIALGFAIVAYFGTSEWQQFADRCLFGAHPQKAGTAPWSGGDFATWTSDEKGLDLQIQVLTAMLCGFKVAGDRTDAQTVWVTFGTIPPNSHMEFDFEISYDNGVTRRPSYWVDLKTTHCDSRGDAVDVSLCKGIANEGRLSMLVVRADRPDSLGMARVTKSSCAVRLRYARQSTVPKVATGAIPISKPIVYPIYSGSGYVQTTEADSLSPGSDE